MGLKPLEFAACYLDSPYFRDNVYEHEKELERTNEKIKGLIKECKNLMKAVDSEYNKTHYGYLECMLIVGLGTVLV